MMVRIPLGDISIHARTAKGVKIINLTDDDKVISAVPVEKANEAESNNDEIDEDNGADNTQSTETSSNSPEEN